MPLVKNLLLLDAEGKRVAVKYFGNTWCAGGERRAASGARGVGVGKLCLTRTLLRPFRRPNTAAQSAFEKTLFTKTSRVNARGERARPRGCAFCSRTRLHSPVTSGRRRAQRTRRLAPCTPRDGALTLHVAARHARRSGDHRV